MRKLIFSVLIFSGCVQPDSAPTPAQAFESFVNDFTTSTEQMESEGDLSASFFSQQQAQTREWLARLHQIDTTQLSPADRVDWLFARTILRGRQLELEQIRPWTKDPRVYMNFLPLSRILESADNDSVKSIRLTKHLRLITSQLQNGLNQIDVNVPRFRALSLHMAENSVELFQGQLQAFIQSTGGKDSSLVVARHEALQSVLDFITFLRDSLPQKPQGNFAIGRAVYDSLLQDHFLLGHDADYWYNYGWEKYNETFNELEALASNLHPSKSWLELANEIKKEGPAPEEMIAAHQKWVDLSREHLIAKNLMPVPWKESVKVVPREPYLRKTSYYGNFSLAKGLSADSTFRSEWRINPFESQWSQAQKESYLIEHDWGVIIVTAPHETYGGHHVQGLYQWHNPRPLRRKFGTSLFAEGWGLYNEQLMTETGFLPNDRIRLRQLQLRLWRNARVIYDIGMHTGRMRYDAAYALMTKGVGFQDWAAESEIDAAIGNPGYFIGYYLGMDAILKMRKRYQELKGDQFSLSEFHERLLAIGNMPPALMERSLFEAEPAETANP